MKSVIPALVALVLSLAGTAAPGQEVDVVRGQATFEEECSRCHVPAETPGSLSNARYMDLAAFLMRNAAVALPDTLSADALLATSTTPAAATEGGDDSFAWTAFNGSNASTRYAPLDQISAENVDELEIAWEFDAGAFGPERESTSVTTPLMVNGRVYVTAGATRNVVALDAATGQIQWMWRPDEGERFDAAPRKGSGKGLTWHDNNGQ